MRTTNFKIPNSCKHITFHLCVLCGSQKKTVPLVLHAFSRLVFITEVESVYCAVRSEFLYEGWNFNFGNAAVTLLQHTYRVHIFTDPRCTPQSYVEHVPSDDGFA